MPRGIPKSGVNRGWFKTGTRSQKRGKTKRVNTCKNCAKRFIRKTHRSKSGTTCYQVVKFCSAECRSEHGIPSRRGKGIKLVFTCWHCGARFRGPYGRRRLVKYCSKKCRFAGMLERGIMHEGAVASLIKQGSKRHTTIETQVYQELDRRGIVYEAQKPVGNRYIVDAYVPDRNLVIECDGSYWHSLPRVIRRDRRKDAYLEKCGFSLLRLEESEIRDNTFVRKLAHFIS